MQDYKVETKVSSDGALIIKGLRFQAGDRVEVIIRSRERQKEEVTCYPLCGKPIRYTEPFGRVAEEDQRTGLAQGTLSRA
jgi:hypothetical protein